MSACAVILKIVYIKCKSEEETEHKWWIKKKRRKNTEASSTDGMAFVFAINNFAISILKIKFFLNGLLMSDVNVFEWVIGRH